MMYLEDYIDKLEHLPETLRNKLAEIKELDLRVESSMNNIKKNVDDLFSKANEMDPDELQAKFRAIMKQGEVSVEESEKKQQLADHIQNLLTKYMNKINQDIGEFATKLEVNYSSITEINEKDQLSISQQNSNLSASSFVSSENLVSPNSVDLQMVSGNTLNHSLIEGLSPSEAKFQDADTQQEFSQMCETEKIELINNSNLLLTDQIDSASCDLLLKFPPDDHLANNTQMITNNVNIKEQSKLKETRTSQINRDDDDEHVDVDKPLYCICNRGSFGSMVACDRKMCLREWFHFGCVGLTIKPKGRWYCPPCTKKIKSRKLRKHN